MPIPLTAQQHCLLIAARDVDDLFVIAEIDSRGCIAVRHVAMTQLPIRVLTARQPQPSAWRPHTATGGDTACTEKRTYLSEAVDAAIAAAAVHTPVSAIAWKRFIPVVHCHFPDWMLRKHPTKLDDCSFGEEVRWVSDSGDWVTGCG